MYNLSDPLNTIKVKSSILDILSSIGIYTLWDILLYIPKRYSSYDIVNKFIDTKNNTNVQLIGEITKVEVMNYKKPTLVVTISDSHQDIKLLFFKYYPNYQSQYKIGKILKVTGIIKINLYQEKTIIHPKVETINSTLDINTKEENSLSIPIYRLPVGISQIQFKTIVQNVFDNVVIPNYIDNTYTNKPHHLMSLKDAIGTIHLLDSYNYKIEYYDLALKRLKIEELFIQQLIMHNIYLLKHKRRSYQLVDNKTITMQLLAMLCFELTLSQKKVIQEICHDIASGYQMNRLLQGDVGSGKTIVAIYTLLIAIDNGYQGCIVAPTEILAKQHYLKTKQLLEPLGINVVWLSGSLTKSEKTTIKQCIKEGVGQVIIGTHALFQEYVEFKNLAVVIIDEQHRFGVAQRISLENKGIKPHILMMSATPIPRTMAMSYYADLDLSIIDELPTGRKPIKTYLINSSNRDKLYHFIDNQLYNKAQVYWVCPLIEESEKLDLQNVMNIAQELKQIFTKYSVGFIHGKMKQKDIDLIMQDFAYNKIQILVATTIIEVGVDVPNASIIVIEDSQRMGLSTLHQLRGRVGRGSIQSYCILLFNYPYTEIARRRLQLMESTNDGFKIATEDLLIRGAGELLGQRQSGVPLLRFADLENDMVYLPFIKDIIVKQNSQDNSIVWYVKLWFKDYQQFLLV